MATAATIATATSSLRQFAARQLRSADSILDVIGPFLLWQLIFGAISLVVFLRIVFSVVKW